MRVNHSIWVLRDTRAGAPCAPDDCEALAELTASVSAALCSAGFAHRIAWFDRTQGCIAAVEADSDDTLTQALAELLAAQIAPDEKTAAQHWLETRGVPDYAHVVLFTLRDGQEELPVADGGQVTVLHAGAGGTDGEEDVYLAL